jgi:hypothetical protein
MSDCFTSSSHTYTFTNWLNSNSQMADPKSGRPATSPYLLVICIIIDCAIDSSKEHDDDAFPFISDEKFIGNFIYFILKITSGQSIAIALIKRKA